MALILPEVLDFIENERSITNVYSIYWGCQRRLSGGVEESKFFEQAKELRYSENICCPHCGSLGIKHHGRYKDTQRYFCKDCGKTFTNRTNCPIGYSRKDLQKWIKFIRCMIEGYSIRKTAEKVGIHRNTAFYWRHKVLKSLQNADKDSLSGIVEADETFFLESFKGNHKKNGFPVSREPRKRGGKAFHRGIGSEQVCVLCAIDR